MADGLELILDDRSSDTCQASNGDSWRVVTDAVMGGLSDAQLHSDRIEGRACLRLKGRVSRRNNGGFVQASNANWAGQRFTIFDNDRGRYAFDGGWIAADAQEVLIPMGALRGGTNYFWALYFENRIDAPGLENATPTSIRFSTSVGGFGQAAAIPEPASWALLIAGFGLVGAVSRRQRWASAATSRA